jgi:hypothetical protein
MIHHMMNPAAKVRKLTGPRREEPGAGERHSRRGYWQLDGRRPAAGLPSLIN